MTRRLAARLAAWLLAFAGDNDHGYTYSRTDDEPVKAPSLLVAGLHYEGYAFGRYAGQQVAR